MLHKEAGYLKALSQHHYIRRDKIHSNVLITAPYVINMDEKNLIKVLATTLKDMALLLTHQDQVGFIQGRSSADSPLSLLQIMWKTFNILFYVLQKFGFGPLFRKQVELMYMDPVATVLTNGIMSSS